MKLLSVFLLISGLCFIGNVQAVEPRELLEVVDFSHPVLSPDGKMVAFRTEQASVASNTYDAFWYVQKVNGTSLPRRIADGGMVLRDTAGASMPVTPVWSPDGCWIYYRASVDGKIDVWRAAVDGSGAVPLTHDPADVRNFRLTDGGHTLQYSVGATREEVRSAEWTEYYEGIHIDSTSPVGQPLFRSGNIQGHLATQRYGKTWFSRVPLFADVPDRWKEVDLMTGEHREMVSPPGTENSMVRARSTGAKGAPWKQVRSANGWVAMLTRVGEKKSLHNKPDVVLSVRAPHTRRPITCTASLCTGKKITGIQWRPGHNEVLFTVTHPEDGWTQTIYQWNIESNAVHLVGNGPWKKVRSAKGWVAMLTRVGEKKGLRFKPDVLLSVRSPHARRPITCTAPLCTGKKITEIQWRPGQSEVLFTVTDPKQGEAQSIYRWNIGSNVVHLVVHARGLVNGGRSISSPCGISTTVLVCVTADANQPPRLERVDLKTGDRQVLFAPNAALAQEMAESRPAKLLRWKDAKGQVFTGQFYPAQSVAGSAAPLFVVYYLCTGFVRGGVGDEYPFASLAAHGISALCINHPSGYIMDAVGRYGRGLAAVKSAIDLLSKRGEIDCTRVGMGGLSFGSEVTLWTSMRTRLLTAASVSTPSITATYYLFGTIRGKLFSDGLKRLWGLGSPEKTPNRWHLLSPQFNVDKISAPILFQMPEQEYLAALNYAIPLIHRGLADIYVFPNEPHQKFQPRHKLAVYERNLDWFRFWLQGYEDPRPSKTAQYARWRAMRESVKQAQASTSRSCKKEPGD